MPVKHYPNRGYRKKGYNWYYAWQKFRWQILRDGNEWWMRMRWLADGSYYEASLSNLNWELFVKEIPTVSQDFGCPPYIASILNEHVCTEARIIRVWHQHLFKHEERDDLYFSAMVNLQSKEYE